MFNRQVNSTEKSGRYQYLLGLGFSTDELRKLNAEGWSHTRIANLADILMAPDENGPALATERTVHDVFYEAAEIDKQRLINAPDFLASFKPLSDFEEGPAEWLIENIFPRGDIVVMGGDGGVGKTSLWCDIAAGISAGKPCFLDPPGTQRDPQRVAILATEDSIKVKLKAKIRGYGGNLENIISPDFSVDNGRLFDVLKFGSDELTQFIRYFKPALCVFDPIQSFIPPDVNMGARNAMRNCTAPLAFLGEEIGTTFLLICHTNKRKGVYGRNRLSDSSDIWDIARSVIFLGETNDAGVNYIAHEKSNYGEKQLSLLFSFDGQGKMLHRGTSAKHDREFVLERDASVAKSTKEGCKEWLFNYLVSASGPVQIKDLDDEAEDAGFSSRTLRRAKEELKNEGRTKSYPSGFGPDKKWFIALTGVSGPTPV